MKAKTYRLKPDITREYLVQNLNARPGGSWIHPSSDVFISKEFTIDGAEMKDLEVVSLGMKRGEIG